MRVRRFTTITPLSESARKSVNSPTGRVFKGVTLIKAGLGNRRDKNFYPPEALKQGVASGLFEGLRAFADHPDSVSEEIQPERSIRDMVGVYENAKYDDGAEAVKADLRILRSHSWLSDAIDELIEAGHGDKIGLSINGRGETEPTRRHLEEAGGEVEVNELKRFIELRSTDVVTEAGAGGGFAQLVESARRAVKESATMKPKMSTVLSQLREAVKKGDLQAAKKLEAQVDTAENDLGEAEDGDEGQDGKGKKTREMGSFGTAGKRRRTYEADREERETEEAEDDADDVDDEAALDEAAETLRAESEVDPAEGDDEADDEDGDDLDEADDEADDEDGDDADETQEAEAPTPAAAKFRRDASRTREGAINGGLGPRTGTVKSGDGRFTKPAKSKGKGGRVNTRSTKGFSTHGMPGTRGRGRMQSTRESAAPNLARENAVLREQNRRLSEAVTRQQSINLATKLLKESSLPAAVRPHVLRDLIGLSKREMLDEINKQASLIEAAVAGASARFDDDFDVVEGAGSTTIRESHFGSRGDGDDLAGVLADCGLPMKRG